jgi:hypothetical protein
MSNSAKISKRFLVTVIVATLCGLLAGALGEIVVRVYILKDFSLPYLSGEVNLSDLNSNSSGLIIRDAKKVVVNQDVKISETLSNIRPVLISVFKEISPAALADNDSPDYYNLEKPLFIGLIITSDGWVVASVPSDLKKDFKIKNYIAIGSDRQIYKIDGLSAAKDLPGDLLIFHLAGVNNLAVKKIIPRSELTLGQTLLAVNGLDSVRPTTLSSLTKTPSLASSDSLNASLDLIGATDDNLKNSFIFDLAGNLAAIVTNDQKIIPAFSYNSFWQSLLKKDAAKRPFLGLNYLDLSTIKTTAVNLNKGAWLYSTASEPAILKNSPAQLAGLKAGDVITWVNNQEINADNDLADVLANYKAGDKITLVYWRDGAEKDVAVQLGELK